MRDVIPIIHLLGEFKEAIPTLEEIPTLNCMVLEDNRGCLDLINFPKVRPKTKHIALKYHHFREHVKNKIISVKYIKTQDQLADIFTKVFAGTTILETETETGYSGF